MDASGNVKEPAGLADQKGGEACAVESKYISPKEITVLGLSLRKILSDYTYGLWIEVRPGDSIVKKKGTLDYLIYEKRNGNRVKRLNWDKKCK